MYKNFTLFMLFALSGGARADDDNNHTVWTHIKNGLLAIAKPFTRWNDSSSKANISTPVENHTFDYMPYIIKPTVTLDDIEGFQEAKDCVTRRYSSGGFGYNQKLILSGSGTDTLLFAQAVASIIQYSKPNIRILQISYKDILQKINIQTMQEMIQDHGPFIFIVDARDCVDAQGNPSSLEDFHALAHASMHITKNHSYTLFLTNLPSHAGELFYAWNFFTTILHFNSDADVLPARLTEYEYMPGMGGTRICFFKFDKQGGSNILSDIISN